MTKTPNLDLPQFVGTDPVKYTDFNDAFMKLDGVIPLVESGTWAPTLIDNSDGGSPLTYTASKSIGVYFKIAKAVFVSFNITGIKMDSVPASHRAGVSGLPFAVAPQTIFSAAIGNRYDLFSNGTEEIFGLLSNQSFAFNTTQGGNSAKFKTTQNGFLYAAGWYLTE